MNLRFLLATGCVLLLAGRGLAQVIIDPPPAGDVNDDGVVDNSDLTIIIQHWNQPTTNLGWQDGNLVGDPTIDNNDLNVVIQNWNKRYSNAIVLAPEPAAVFIPVGGVLLAMRRRRPALKPNHEGVV